MRSTFAHFARGIQVSIREYKSVLNKFFKQWVARWLLRYVKEPRAMKRRTLLRAVFVEWKWCALWGVSEKRCVYDEELDRRLRRLPTEERGVVVGMQQQQQQQQQTVHSYVASERGERTKNEERSE